MTYKRKKTTCKKLNEFYKEEVATSKDYKQRGFIKQGEQEKEHSEFFKSQIKKKKNCKVKR